MKLITTSPKQIYFVDIEGMRFVLNKTLTGKHAINVLFEGCNLFFYRTSEKEWVEVTSDKPANNIISKPLNQAFRILRKLQKDHKDYKYAQAN